MSGAVTSLHGRKLGVDESGNLISYGRTILSPAFHAITEAPGAANHATVTVQLTDASGANVAAIREVRVYLSDSATGAGITATTPSGGLSVTTGTSFDTDVASKAIDAQTDATGRLVFDITDTAKTGFYVCVRGLNGSPVVFGPLVAGSYG